MQTDRHNCLQTRTPSLTQKHVGFMASEEDIYHQSEICE